MPKLTKEEYERRARAIQAPPPGTPAPLPQRAYYDPSNPNVLSAPGTPIPYGQSAPASGGPALAWGQGPAMQPEGPSVAQPYGYVPGVASVVPNQALAWGQGPALQPAPYYGPDVNPQTGAYAAAQAAQTAPQVQAAAAKVVAAAPAELRSEAQAAQRQAAYASTPAEVAAAKLAVERVADQANAGSKVVLYSAIGFGALGVLGLIMYLARRK